MAKNRKNPSFVWSDLLPKVLNACLLVCVVCNFLALAWSVRSTTPKVVRQIDNVVTNHFFTITQLVERVSVSSDPSPRSFGASKVESVSLEVPTPYHYMSVNGEPMFKYYGRNYKVGDLTSYGRIEAIFPDRVRLEGSVFLKNTNNPDKNSLVKENST